MSPNLRRPDWSRLINRLSWRENDLCGGCRSGAEQLLHLLVQTFEGERLGQQGNLAQ